jgi:putative FmdB family regulatory protein
VPVFEFRCLECGKKFSDLVGMTVDSSDSKCPHCGSARNTKLISRFARYRNEDARVEAIADHLDQAGEPESPSAIRAMVREMGQAMDDDISDEMEEMFESDMDAGEGP